MVIRSDQTQMRGEEESGKAIAWTLPKTITKVILDASKRACDADGGFHLPKCGLEFLLAAPLWGQSVCFSLRTSSGWAGRVKGGF